MATLQITFASESAGYDNVLGWYNSRTGEAGIIFINTNDDGPRAGISPGTTATLEVDQADIDAGNIGFFVIPNGADIYGAGKKSVLNGPLSFDTKPNGDGQILDAHGHALRGEQGELIFTDPTLNKHDTDYTSSHAGRHQSATDLASDNADGITGRIAFEDLTRKSDRDFNDLVVDVKVVTKTLHGQALDGYVYGATVFADADGNGTLDSGERNTTTDASGNFTLIDGSGPLVMVGGVDIATGLPFAGVLRAPEGASVVTPLTTLIAALVDQGQTLATASANVASAFGLDGLTIDGQPLDLLNLDPIPDALVDGDDGDAAAIVLGAGIQVRNTIVQIGALLAGAGATDAQAAATAALVALVSSGAEANLDDPPTVQALINAAADIATGVSPSDIAAVVADAALVLAESNDAVDDALADGSGMGVLQALAQVATVAQGAALSADLAQSGATNDPGSLAIDYTGTNLETKLAFAPVGDVDGGSAGTPGDDVLTGGPGNDVMTGLGGNDQLYGLAGNDQLDGGDGNDVLVGDIGNDTLRGGAGNDILNGGVLADLQSDIGFRDTDRADYSAAASGVNVNLATGIAQDGDGGTDTLIGVEAVTGSAYDDVLTGGADVFVELFRGGAGNDTIDGGSWNDRAEYMNATGGIVVKLAALAPNKGTVTGDASVGTDTLTNVEFVTGTDFADSFVATGFLSAPLPGGFLSNFNAFEGRAGNDTIVGNGNTRIEFAGATAGVMANLATGIATGDASVGTDTFSGVTSLRGSAYADTLLGGSASGSESFEGRGGDDFIDGKQGFDQAAYAFDGPISTGITVNLAAGTVSGDPVLTGTDTLRGIEGVRGSHLNDRYDATGFSSSSLNSGSLGTYNEFEGMAGDDTITGNGNTRIIYTAAREGVSVDLAAGTVVGGASVGIDKITILGSVFAVRGSNFGDVLIGSGGNEHFEGRAGNDTIDGGGGFDTAAYDVGASGGGTFIASPLGTFTATAPGVGTDSLSNIETIIGTNFGDLFDGSVAALGFTFNGGFGNDTLIGSQGSDNLFGGDGDDVLVGSANMDYMYGGLGNDRADYADSLDAINADLSLNSASDGMGGVDFLYEIETITGTNFSDTLIGDSLANSLEGGLGNDFLRGGGGNDELNGGVVADLQSDVGFQDTDGVDYSTAARGVNVNLATGVALDGDGGTDRLIGIESVNGSMYDDAFTGSNTTFSENFHGGGGNDHIEGGGGFDRGEYQSAAAMWDPMLGAFVGVTINVGDLSYSSASAGATVSGDISTVGFDTMSNVEQFTGSEYADTYTAGRFLSDAAPGGVLTSFNAFEGRGGDDLITGNGSTRVEYTNAAVAVTVNLGTGATTAEYAPSVGTDTFKGGISWVRGSSFNDTLTGSANFNDETFDGRGGNDSINGGVGFDRADYAFNGPASVGIIANLAAGTVAGDAELTGTDTLFSVEAIRGTHLNDTYNATGFSGSGLNPGSLGTLNEFEGMAGDDTVIGNGNTRINFSLAREGVTVDLQAHEVVGGDSVGHDTIVGGVNAMRGSNFDDVLMGTNHGIAFAEIYEGRRGVDIFSGRGGYDQARYDTEANSEGIRVDMDAINAFTGTVTGSPGVGTDKLIDIVSVVGTFFNDTYDGAGYDSAISGLDTFNEFEGGLGDDTIIGNGNTRASYIGGGGGVTVNLGEGSASGGTTGNDTLSGVNAVRGSNFNDHLIGSAADETFEGRGGVDAIDAGAGFDLARYDIGATGGGSFVADALGSFTATAGGLGTDVLTGIESIRGTNFGDLFDGSASSTGYTFLALGGNDTLIGSQGSDSLNGGDGNDLLRGGQGVDFLDGGLGQDRFDFDHPSEGIDSIINFAPVPGGDVLDIADLLGWTSYAGGAGGDLSQFVRFANVTGGSQLQIDTDGLGDTETWQGLATLQGHSDLALTTLLINGNVDVDVLI